MAQNFEHRLLPVEKTKVSAEQPPVTSDIEPGIDQLLTIDFTEPEGSAARYSVTIVPRYEAEKMPDSTSDQEYFYFQQGVRVVSAVLSAAESLPILQSMDSRSGLAATPEAAAKIALGNWIASQRMEALDGIDLQLQ